MNITKIVVLGFLFSSFAAAAPVELPKTGQTLCYAEAGQTIDCADTGQDGDIQAGAAWPSPRFVDNNDRTITDNLTGLMWLQDPTFVYKSLPTPRWDAALGHIKSLNINGGDPTYPSPLPGPDGAPYTDWRAPNAIELESLSNVGQLYVMDWLEAQGFINMFGSWSSTTVASTYEPHLGKAWMMTFNALGGSDTLSYNRSKSNINGAPILAVRTVTPGNATWRTGQTLCYNSLNSLDIPPPTYADTIIDCAGTGQDGETQTGVVWPSPRFTDEGDGTVTDNLTGLVWLKDANCMGTNYPANDTDLWVGVDPAGDGRVTWQHALDFVAGINDGSFANCGAGKTDWHLPNRREALSLLDFSRANPDQPSLGAVLPTPHPFTNLVSPYMYWTSTSHMFQTDKAIALTLSAGVVGAVDKKGMINNIPGYLSQVWPVRAPVPTPIPEISVSPASHNFGPVTVNGFSASLEIVLSNIGTADLNVANMLQSNSQNFILHNNAGLNPCGSANPVIPAGGNCTVTVTFRPDSVASFNGILSINSDSLLTGTTTNINLSGAGVLVPIPDISITPMTHVFNDVVVNKSSPMLPVTLSNLGNQVLNISAIALTSATDYSLNLNAGSNPCATNNPVIAAAGNCTVGVTFTPSMLANNLTDTLTIASDDPDESSVVVQLSGNGVSETPPPSLDEVPPLVASFTPAPNNTPNVPASIAAITATFSEPVQGVNVATFVVSSAGGDVAGTVQYDAPGMTGWFTPAADLDYLTTYTVTLAAAQIRAAQIRDLADNNLAQDFTWSFTTGGDPALAGCEPELQQEEGCVNFDYFTYGTGIELNTYGSSVTGFATEEAARQSVSFGVSVTTRPPKDTGSSRSEATARVDATGFSLNSHSRRMSPSSDLAGTWSMGASKIEVSGVPPGTVIPMSIVVEGGFDGPGGTLLLQVKDFDDYRGLGSLSTSGSGVPFTYEGITYPANTYTRMVDPYGDKSDAANHIKTTSNGSNNLRLDFLYPAIPNNGIYVWFVAGIINSENISNDDTNFTATLEVDPPPGVTVTLASGQVFTGDMDTDGDGVSDLEETATASDASIASPASANGANSILIDASANVGVTLSQVHVLDHDDVSLLQTGKPAGRQFPDGLASFRLNGLAPGADAIVRLTFPTAFPADRSYYKVNDAGFYKFPDANITFIDTHTVELRVTDGGTGDRDGIVNGVIVDPGGVAIPVQAPVVSVSKTVISAATFSAGDGEQPVFEIVINSDSNDAEIHALTIESTGTVSNLAAFGTVSIYRDDNMDGVPAAAELIATGSYTSGDSQLTFTLAQPYQLPAGDTHLLITYQF